MASNGSAIIVSERTTFSRVAPMNFAGQRIPAVTAHRNV